MDSYTIGTYTAARSTHLIQQQPKFLFLAHHPWLFVCSLKINININIEYEQKLSNL